MPNTSDPKILKPDEITSKANEDETATASSNRWSLLGLGLVSVLNIGCIAFVAYHFSSDRTEPAHAQPLSLRPGNVALEPASSKILPVASAIEQTAKRSSGSPADQVAGNFSIQPGPSSSDNQEMAGLTEPSGMGGPFKAQASPADETVHWVQLGALSKTATANSFWEKLRKSHATLLHSHQPSIFGPDQVGGSLYHLRVGPLNIEAAEDLCSALQEAGTDCFCIDSEGQQTRQWTPDASKA